MKFLLLHTEKSQVLVNLDLVQTISPCKGGAQLQFSEENFWEVTESFSDIQHIIEVAED